MELWVGAVNLGFLYAFMTMGVFITFRIHDFPDITVDGSFTSGAAAAAVLIASGANPFLALLAAFAIGSAAGCITAAIHTRFNINGLLAGILVMTGLYSINLHLMGRSNIPLLNQTTCITYLEKANPGMPQEVWICIMLSGTMILFWLAVSLFFKTDLGIAMRITGNNPTMAAAAGVNVNRMKMFGVALANGLVGIAGGLVAQYQGFADIGMGIGTVVIGLAAVIIGESVLKMRSMYARILSVIVGSVIFRMMIAVALYVGMNPIDLKLLTAAFVLITLVASKTLSAKRAGAHNTLKQVLEVFSRKRIRYAAVGALVVIAGAVLAYRQPSAPPPRTAVRYKIGLVQLTDNGLLNTTRDSFVKEMETLGYRSEENCILLLENAHGDLATVNTILDKFIQEQVDIVVPISTACTQAAINKLKGKPVVFATVANPFIIGAGKTDTDHLANVTGVYGWAPMDRMMEVVHRVLPRSLKIGALWDPAQANSVFNVTNLQKAVAAHQGDQFLGATITSSAEVHQAAVSLVYKGIDTFVLSPDNIVYSAFESVVKAAQTKHIPIFISDVERLADGALVALGYDYTTSGIQAAHLVDRVLKGEQPGTIPFERYSKLTFGINTVAARKAGITIPPDMLTEATVVHTGEAGSSTKKPVIGIVQFALEPNVELCKQGILKALRDYGYEDGKNIEIIYKNAQADFSLINAIIQDLVRRRVDIIVPLSTPCVQSAVQFAGTSRDTAVVFTYVYDPYRIGAAKSPTEHLPTMTGISCFPPAEKMLDLIRELFPGRTKIGVVWNSSEANSESVMGKLRAHAAKTGLEIIEATVTSPAEVLEASRSLAIKGAQVFLNGGDNTLNVSFDSFVKVADENKLPVFSVDSELVERGALAALGPDYNRTGYQGGEYLARVLKGQKPADLPIRQTQETLFYINLDVARRHGFTIDEAVIQRANRVIDSTAARPAASTSTEGKKLALFLFSDHTTIRDTAQGVRAELEQSGTLGRHRITIDTKNAQNEFYMAQSIAQDIVSQKYDYIITLTTPVLQAMANANKKIPHIFGAVTNPYRMGIAKSSTDHLPNMTGVATIEPVEATIKAMRELFPRARRIGIVWNPGEACSETCTYKAREAARQYQFDLLEVTVSSTAEVMDAVKSLLSRKVDLFLTSGDNTAIMALESIAGLLRQQRIPYFTNAASDIERGTFISIGPDYVEVGRETARMAERVINGQDPKQIPIENYAPDKMFINLSLAEEYGVAIPPAFLQKAAQVLYRGKLVSPSEAGMTSKKSRAKRLALFLFSDNVLLVESSKGVMQALEQSGTLKQHRITIDTKNAQNEFYMAQSIAQDIVRQNYDYIITLSTPALQVMANINKKIPHVFGAVTDPYRMGVAKNSTDHLPNVTGVATFQPVATAIQVMRELLPNAQRIGMVWNPGEACSEACTLKARAAARQYNFELIESTVSSTSEVLDAVKSLIHKDIDVYLTSGDNTVIMALESIAALLRQHKIAYFTNAPSDIERGAIVGIGADYIEVGRATARVAEQVMNGQDPKTIPINDYVPQKMYINLSLAKELGIAVPDDLLKRAAVVKR